jgi:L-malate glycosyltransferase
MTSIALAGPIRVADLAPWLDLPDEADAPTGLGGTPVTLLARGLLRRGYALTIISLDLAVTDEVILSGPRLRVCIGHFRARHRGRDGYRHERRYLTGALRRERPSLVHAHWTYEYALAALSSGAPTLVTMHDWAPTILRIMPDPYRAVRLVMNARALAAAKHLTAVSPYLAQRVRRWRRPLLGVVPNGVEDEAFLTAERVQRADDPVLVAVNDGFTARKNVGTLLKGHRLLRTSYPAARLLLVGTDYEQGGLADRWARQQRLSEGVEFHGPVPYLRVRQLLREADVFVHPSIEESFGLVLLEAMAQRLPVVAGARSGAVPWVLANGRAGQLTDITQPAQIASAVRGLVEDGGRYQAVARAGYEHAWKHFRMDRVVDGYLEVYERVRPGIVANSAGHWRTREEGR